MKYNVKHTRDLTHTELLCRSCNNVLSATAFSINKQTCQYEAVCNACKEAGGRRKRDERDTVEKAIIGKLVGISQRKKGSNDYNETSPQPFHIRRALCAYCSKASTVYQFHLHTATKSYEYWCLDCIVTFNERQIFYATQGYAYTDDTFLDYDNETTMIEAQRDTGSALSDRNKTGHKGISIHSRTKKYVASYTVNRRSKYIGLFDTVEEAVWARDEFIEKLLLEDERVK